MKRCIATLPLLLAALSASGRTVYPLNEGWRFFFRHENSSDNARIVSLPHTWDTDITGSGVFLRTTGTYLNEIFIPAEWKGKRLFLKFYGAQSVADLFVNGRHAGEHRGGATAFVFEITDKVRCGAANDLRVDVSNTWQNDVLPTSSDHNLYGGLYREAELILTDRTAVTPDYYGADGLVIRPKSVTDDRVEAEAEIRLLAAPGAGSCNLSLEITAPDGYRALLRSQKAKLDGKPVTIPFALDDPVLWEPESPALYTLTVRVEEGDARDSVSIRTGFRDIRVTADGGLRINGRRFAVKGVSLYHDNLVSGGAPTRADYDADLAFVRELGANAVRSAGMPHGQYFYDRCDSEGLLAWIELPFLRAPFLGDVDYYATPRFEQNGRRQLCELIAQHINHPSVAMWGIFSCLWTRGDDPDAYVRSLDGEARRMDPSRPTVACSNRNGEINFITDLIVWQQNVGWDKGSPEDVKVWSALMRKNWSRLRSGVAYGNEGMTGHRSTEAHPAPDINWLPESRQTRFHESYAKHLDGDSLFWGVWINNLFDFGSARRPYGINASGLVTLDRRERKDAFYLYKALWNRREPTLRIADRRRRMQAGEPQQFRIYAQQMPVLTVAGDTVRVREWAPCQYLSDTVTISGPCTVVATAGGLADSAEIRAGSVLRVRPQQVPLRRGGPQQTN